MRGSDLVSLGFSLLLLFAVVVYGCAGGPETDLDNLSESIDKMEESIDDSNLEDDFDKATKVAGFQCGFEVMGNEGMVDLDDPKNAHLLEKHCSWLDGLTVTELIQTMEDRTPKKNLFNRY